MTNKLSLYFHVPFCEKKCNYCAFYSLPKAEEDLKEEYFKALLAHIGHFETERPIATIYFGGGTPPVLGVDRLCYLLSNLKKRYNLTDDCEITVEINPSTVDKEDLAKLKAASFNRLSVGIQSADDLVLKNLGRIHSFAQAKECIENAREVGFKNISADLIFALPHQSFESFKESIHKFIALDVNHISAYSLQLEEGTAFYKRQNQLIFPTEEEEEAQYNHLWQTLEKAGFVHYEVSSFAKKGFESRHNLTYWSRGDYFGFGAGAHSLFNGSRFETPCDVMKYIAKAPIDLYAPTDFADPNMISFEEAEEERIMLGLRTAYGAIIPEKAYDFAFHLAKQGFGSFENGRLALNSKGFRVSNSIIGKILTL